MRLGTIEEAIACLRGGGLACFPTETLWSLSARADDPDAVKAVFAAKKRPEGVPLAIGVASWEDARGFVADLPDAHALARRFLPGPVSLVMPRTDTRYAHCAPGFDTLSIRVPDHPAATTILEACGPLVMTSANEHGHPDPRTDQEVLRMEADGIVVPGRVPGTGSTVVDVQNRRILREGMISQAEVDAAWL